MTMEKIKEDIQFIKSILPNHYTVQESKKRGSIHCVSKIGLRKGIDNEDKARWNTVLFKIEAHFKERFQEVFHNVCFCHTDFTIYIKPVCAELDKI